MAVTCYAKHRAGDGMFISQATDFGSLRAVLFPKVRVTGTQASKPWVTA
ncbi:MAG: hypothetical protein RL345_966 [Chloroflexota bacterium]